MFFELTSAQIDQFNEDGFVIVDKLIDDETVEALHARYGKTLSRRIRNRNPAG